MLLMQEGGCNGGFIKTQLVALIELSPASVQLTIGIRIRVRPVPQIHLRNVLKFLVLRIGLENMSINFFENRFTIDTPNFDFLKIQKSSSLLKIELKS